ncbi:kinetochore-associated protein 1 isoform X2 [Ceratina calcarata]|uniref:Kinetochore-associated protein 1 isoform X2 n=1 Tax=Ceratina calcarata TaxID=156304 RepID=A0AAJ7RZ26_9HYME|nr:kinetochore-associated protein 1 isoform X2 [Ceratina calcarata]
MASWNKVVSGFKNEDETINFGARTLAENNGLLYEAYTIATIESDGKVTKDPNIIASVQYSRVCIVIDKSITIFESEQYEEVLLSITFELDITCYCVSRDGVFVFVVLSNGELCCLHLSKSEVIFTKNITDGIKVIALFLQNETNGWINIFAVSERGTIYRISGFKTSESIASNEDKNKEIASNTECTALQCECTTLFKGFPSTEVTYATAGTVGNSMYIAMLSSNMLFMWPSEHYIKFSSSQHSYTKVKFLKNYMAMLCLRADRTLSMICPRTLLGITVNNAPVTDFAIIENNDNSSCQIVTLTSDCKEHTVHVLSYPDFQEKFQITVPVVTFLVEIMDPCDEIILYLEGVNVNAITEYVDMIRLKTVSESMPEHQLGRLIRREQFDAAEDFANTFDLSKEPIYCAKAALLLSQLGPWAKERPDLNKVDTILDIFDKIENVQYIVECCSKALIPNYEQMRRFHLYARSRIMKNTAEHLNLLPSINDVMHKLETFHMIWGCKRDMEYYDEDTVKAWIRFSRADFLEEYKTHLRMGEFEAATSIWTRHLPDMIKHVNIEVVKGIFTILPENTSPSALWPWLSNYVPTLLSFIPSAICEIILWGCKRIKLFEQFYHSKWPQIGIDFANKFIKILRFEERSLCLQEVYSEGDTYLKQLTLLMQAMSDIKKLKDNYRLIISLDSYIGDPIEVTYILLDKVHVDVIPEFLNTFLKRYMLNNSLEGDYAFSSYIQKMLTNSKGWWLGEETFWERKVIVIIDLIQKVETKLQQTLEVLKRASVPWSSTIVALVETSCKYDHALTAEIRTEQSFVPVKLILKKYGYERVGVNGKLMQRVIKENRDSMISDLQQLTKNDVSLKKQIFSNCVNYHLSMGNLEDATNVLNSLENDVLLHCCENIGGYVEACLKFNTVPEYITYHIEMFGWVRLQLEKFSREARCSSNDIIDSLDRIKSMYMLKKDFGISITVDEYFFKKKEILRNYITRLFNEASEEEEMMIYKKVTRVADLLALERTDATTVSLLLESTSDDNLLNFLIRCIKKQLNEMASEPQYAYKICLPLMQHADKVDVDLAATIQNICSLALSVCPGEELPSVLDLYSWATLYKECSSRSLCAIDAKQEIEEIPRKEWKEWTELYEMYKDPAIGANQSVLPLFGKVISTQMSCIVRSDAEEIHSSTEDSMNKLIDKMKGLRGEHNDYRLLQIVKTVYIDFCCRSQINTSLLMEMKSIYLQRLTMLLKKIISARGFDLQLGLSCLFMLSDSEACAWISTAYKSYQPDCIRHLRIVELGHAYFHLTRNHTLLEPFQNNKLLYYWAGKLSKYSVSYNEILTSDLTAKRKILQGIMTYNDDMIPLFHEFCSDFGFDFQDCLLLYLEVVVKTWNPTLHVDDYNGKEELRIDEEEVMDLRKKCDLIASYINDQIALKNRIRTCLLEVNFYHYEVFIILMDLINEKDVEKRIYFYFLQNYTRVGQPTKIELDEWLHINPGYTSAPPIAKWRLPYFPKINLLNIITPELNLKTYEKWLEIADIFKLQPHIICTLAIKGEVTQTWENARRTTSEWSLCPRNSTLLNNIKKCIEKMTDPDALYYGTAALYYAVNQTPPGADQVAAAEECFKYAQLSVQKSTQFQESMLEKIKFKYLRFSTEHILRTHGLGDTKYLSLIGNPDKLVRELYTDESIPKRYQYTSDHRPDINSAVNSISQLYGMNIVKLRMELLQGWLQPDVKYLSRSVTETFSIPHNSESNSNSFDNLARACYILEHGDLELSANFLINIAFNDKNEDYCPEARYRALRVLQSIVDPAKLEDLTKRDHQTIRNYMKSLMYISKLESLGISCSVNAFEMCSKHEIVQMLWKSQRYSPQAFITIAELCIDFEIYEYSLWDKVLVKLAESLMITELKRILLQVRNEDGCVPDC